MDKHLLAEMLELKRDGLLSPEQQAWLDHLLAADPESKAWWDAAKAFDRQLVWALRTQQTSTAKTPAQSEHERISRLIGVPAVPRRTNQSEVKEETVRSHGGTTYQKLKDLMILLHITEVPTGVIWAGALLLLIVRLMNVLPSPIALLSRGLSSAAQLLVQPALYNLLDQPILWLLYVVCVIIALVQVQHRFSVQVGMQLVPVQTHFVSTPYSSGRRNSTSNTQAKNVPNRAGDSGRQATVRPLAGRKSIYKWINVSIALAMLSLAAWAPLKRIEGNPPPVPNAAKIRETFAHQNLRLTYYGDSAVGNGHELDVAAAARFTQDTGIKVDVITRPESATDAYDAYLRQFRAKTKMDVVLLDVVWLRSVSNYFIDLRPHLSHEADEHLDTIITGSMVDDKSTRDRKKLVAMPLFDDFGLLYYRADLIQKYGNLLRQYRESPENFTELPQVYKDLLDKYKQGNPFQKSPDSWSWNDLEEMAVIVQEGERVTAKNPNFYGFVFQGAAYEGAITNAIEWGASQGGSLVIGNGTDTITETNAIAALNRARSWVGTIAPQEVTTYKEEETRKAFQSGNAAFMRNWPYAYRLLQDPSASAVSGRFDIAPLPHGAAPGQVSVGTVGGGQLGVSIYSDHKDAAVEFVRYMSSADVQLWRALVGSYIPTVTALRQTNQQVHEMLPFLEKFDQLEKQHQFRRITRPTPGPGENYNQMSKIFFLGINQVLFGANAAQVVPKIDHNLPPLITSP